MKESFWAYGLIIVGIFVFVVLSISQGYTTTNEENYYLVKEAMQASMLESVDFGVYRQTGDFRIIKEKFIENFTRRFSQSVRGNKDYKIEFYEIYENPPKATVKITTDTGEYTVDGEAYNFNVVTTLSGIVEIE